MTKEQIIEMNLCDNYDITKDIISSSTPTTNSQSYISSPAITIKRNYVAIIKKILILSLFFVILPALGLFGYAYYKLDEAINNITTEPFALADNEALISTSYVKNYLILGIDAREALANTRSDCMILVSINENKKTINLVSFQRDTLVNICGLDRKLNSAYQLGGAQVAAQTIENLSGLKLDGVITVDFNSFVNIIDIFGGIDITITSKEEYDWINKYVCDNASNLGMNAEANQLGAISSIPGTMTVNGIQALAYSRIRKVGTTEGAGEGTTTRDDWSRNGRQRAVLMQLISKVKSFGLTDISKLYQVIQTVTENITTNLSHDELMSIIFKCINYRNYTMNSVQFPEAGTFSYGKVNSNSVVIINDMTINRQHLIEKLY